MLDKNGLTALVEGSTQRLINEAAVMELARGTKGLVNSEISMICFHKGFKCGDGRGFVSGAAGSKHIGYGECRENSYKSDNQKKLQQRKTTGISHICYPT